MFDIFHKATSLLLSPSEIWRVLFGWFSFHGSDGGDDHTYDLDVPVQTATLGDIDPATSTRQATFHQSMNTDARTCQDVITELGYMLYYLFTSLFGFIKKHLKGKDVQIGYRLFWCLVFWYNLTVLFIDRFSQ